MGINRGSVFNPDKSPGFVKTSVSSLRKLHINFKSEKRDKYLLISRQYFLRLLKVYANIWFSENPVSGVLFFLSTFIVPEMGVSGLTGFLFSGILVKLFCPSISGKRADVICCNGVLSALAVSFTYEFSPMLILILFSASFLNLLLSFFLMGVFEKYAGLPVLSIPFVFTSWIIILAVRLFPYFRLTLKPMEASFVETSWVFTSLPAYMASIFKSFGTVFFQTNIYGSLIILAGVLIFSRQAFLLGLTGVVTASFFFKITGSSAVTMISSSAGFNFILTAIAVGGIFSVPSFFSFILAAGSSLIAAIIYSASLFFLSDFNLSPLALPFVITTDLVFYILKYGLDYSVDEKKWLKVMPFPMKTPEDNLSISKNERAHFFKKTKPLFYLPVSGSWRVTQGFHGRFTHRELWAHGMDFEITDNNGVKFKNRGFELEDYYSWNMPVFAPGHGKVVYVSDGVEDNEVGKINTSKNFGNTVMIWHQGDFYSVLSHLSKGSVSVKAGDFVNPGDIIGRVGNSGRSPYPHLHFQVQRSMTIGAPTIPFEFINFTEINESQDIYRLSFVPKEGLVVKKVERDQNLLSSLTFFTGMELKFQVESIERKWTEIWEIKVDLHGKQYIQVKNTKDRLYFSHTKDCLIFIDYRGKGRTVLEALFLGASIIPFGTGVIRLKQVLPEKRLLSMGKSFLYDLISPFVRLYRLDADSVLQNERGGWKKMETMLRLNRSGSTSKEMEISVFLDPVKGIQRITMKNSASSKLFLEAERIE